MGIIFAICDDPHKPFLNFYQALVVETPGQNTVR